MAGPGGSDDCGDDDVDTPTLIVHVVHIPALQRHLAGGWSEDQLLSGRVYTVGRRELDLKIRSRGRDGKGATLMDVAEAVEDAWGCDVEDQAYRTAGGALTLVPGPAKGRGLGDGGEYGIRAASRQRHDRGGGFEGVSARTNKGTDGDRLLRSLGIRHGTKLLMSAGGPRGGVGTVGCGPSGRGGCGTLDFAPTQTVLEDPEEEKEKEKRMEKENPGIQDGGTSAAAAAAAAAARRVAGGGAPDITPPPSEQHRGTPTPVTVTFLGSSQRLGGGGGGGGVGGEGVGGGGGVGDVGGGSATADDAAAARRAAMAQAAERRAASTAAAATASATTSVTVMASPTSRTA